ncbi:MAG: transcriptional repressor [Candidatus Promineofilum sp.]|nr:transcriptional repressor [Promineifilum sp.]
MTHDTHDIAATIRAHGHRLTLQRQIILDTLCEMGGHVTVAELYEQVGSRYPAIDRSTLYRALDFFGQLGLVRATDVGGTAVYEMANLSDANGHAHHHLICRNCGFIDHVSGEAFNEFAGHLRDHFGFVAEVDSLTVYGVCRECNSAGGA